MGNADRIVDLSISTASAVVSQAGFGIIAVFGEFAPEKTSTAFNERVRSYGGADEAAADGWSEDDTVMKAVNSIFSQTPAPSEIVVCRKDEAESWSDAFAAAKLENDSWYGMVLTSRTLVDQKSAADWAQANAKLLGIATADANAKSSTDETDIGFYVKSKNYDYVFVIFHPDTGTDDESFAEAAWLANRFPYTPGKTTWKFCTLSGSRVYSLTTNEINALKEKNINIYTTVKGLSMTEEGVTGSGEFIDVRRGIDWLHARMQENIIQLKKSATDRGEKISFTDEGISQVDSVMKETLSKGVDNGLLKSDPEPVTSVPMAMDVAEAERGARTLPDATFEAYLDGAIHITKIRGAVLI